MKLAEKIIAEKQNNIWLFSAGQAGFIIKSKSGQLLGMDLYLSECVERIEGHIGYKRLLPQLLQPQDLTFDVLICSHYHWDHFDYDSVPELMANGKTKLFAARDCKELTEQLNMDGANITYVKPGDTYSCGDFSIEFVNCDHGDGAPLAVGFVITVDGKRIYFAGDTCLRLDRIDEVKKSGDIDVMIAPINGAYGNLNEEECAVLADAIKPGLTIPCHYGMFASHGGDPGQFYEIMKNKYPANRFTFLAQGEGIIF